MSEPAGSHAQHQHENTVAGLGKRVKELTALHRTARLLQDRDRDTGGLLAEIVDLLPAAWQFPTIAAIRLSYGALEARSLNFAETSWRLDACFQSADGTEGCITVVYLEERPPQFDGPFLAEECHLLDSLCDMLRSYFDRRQAEKALRASEERYRQLFENAPYGIYRATLEGALLDVNPALVEMLGYGSREELLGCRVARHIFWNPEEGAQFIDKHKDLKHFRGFEADLKRRDGSSLKTRSAGRVNREANGNASCFEVIVENVTHQRTLELHLRQAQRMESVGRLAGGIAHDFNNLLGVILGYSELLVSSLPTDEKLHDMAVEIHKAGQSAATLTRQLLAFSRQQVLQPKVLNLNTVVTDMEKLLKRLLGEDIDFVTRLESVLWPIKADPGQIEQVLMNLVINSRDAMPYGGTMVIETANVLLAKNDAHPHPHLEMRPGNYVVLTVADSGCGMDQATQGRIFEPFFTTKEKNKGTGLGLATVYGIVKQSGGYIWVYSEPKQGTTFKVYFPLVEAPVEVEPESDTGQLAAYGRETILLVENEDSLRALTLELLEARGYTVLEAANGVQALELAEQYPGSIHLLLTDVVMPKMNGTQLAESLTARHPGVRVLYVSGYAETMFNKSSALPPGTAFLQKPFGIGELAQTVRELLESPASRLEVPVNTQLGGNNNEDRSQ